jgi:zinc/manganese transport system ATP-binding protein
VNPPDILVEALTLRHQREVAVIGLTGTFPAGSLTAVVGPNGGGKTTLLRALAGLHPPTSGRIYRGKLKPGDIALLPQASQLDRTFPVTCLDVVTLGHWSRIGPFRAVGPALRRSAEDALAEVGLAALAQTQIGRLSAGQFQRVLFARLIVQDAPVMLFDEPFNAIDQRTIADLMRLLRRWHQQGRTIVVVLHDLDLVGRAFPTTLLLARGQVAWGPTAEALAPANRRTARLWSDSWLENAVPAELAEPVEA